MYNGGRISSIILVVSFFFVPNFAQLCRVCNGEMTYNIVQRLENRLLKFEKHYKITENVNTEKSTFAQCNSQMKFFGIDAKIQREKEKESCCVN